MNWHDFCQMPPPSLFLSSFYLVSLFCSSPQYSTYISFKSECFQPQVTCEKLEGPRSCHLLKRMTYIGTHATPYLPCLVSLALFIQKTFSETNISLGRE